MNEIVELVARAIAQRLHDVGLAKAAIAGMREPTEEMLDVGVTTYDRDSYHMSTYHCLGLAWRAMIDEALKE